MQFIPLAERVRPQTIDDIVGQTHLLGEKAPIRQALLAKKLPSIIFWGPPGVGKTTIARILAKECGFPFKTLSAVTAGVKEVRAVIDETKLFGTIILFIDEIHRFNKSQQDSLLGAIESGKIILIGATTENPSFEVNNALLSRCQVYTLNPLTKEELNQIIINAFLKDDYLKKYDQIKFNYYKLIEFSGQDARKLLNGLESLISNSENKTSISDEEMAEILQDNSLQFDKDGEYHYDVISAFIKSIRGSDPQAAIYYLARMIAGGEKPDFVARRLVILASEDIGMANPNALLYANACMQSVKMIGMPESRIILSNCTIYLATSPKSNSTYMAIDNALAFVKKTGNLPIPLQLRNSPTPLMKDLGYGQNYQYAHNYKNNFVFTELMPTEISNQVFYYPASNTKESEIKKSLLFNWKNKYNLEPKSND
jgi:putative ATPase